MNMQLPTSVARGSLSYSNKTIDPKVLDNHGWSQAAAKALGMGAEALDAQGERISNAMMLEQVDKLSQFEYEKLHDPKSGYYTLKGKAALGKGQEIVNEYNKLSGDILKNSQSLSRFDKVNLQRTILNKRNNIVVDTSSYERRQSEEWQKAVIDGGVKTQIDLAIGNRNNLARILVCEENIKNTIKSNSGYSDPELLDLQTKDAVSKMYAKVITAQMSENNPDAYSTFKAVRSKFKEEDAVELENNLRKYDANLRSRFTVDEWIASGLTEGEAYKKAHSIEDLELRDALESRVSYQYGKNEAAKRDIEESAWNNLEQNPSLDNIPLDLDFQTRERMKKYVLNGGGKTNPQSYADLYEMSVTNAEAFSKLNLNEYRNVLTKVQYQSFLKTQIDIRQHGYSSFTPDDAMVVEVAKQLGLRSGKDNKAPKAISGQLQEFINEEERRLGKQLKGEELKSVKTKFSEYLGYKDGEKGTHQLVNEYGGREGFYHDVINDVTYYQKQHGRMPDNKEFNDMVYGRAFKSIQKRNDYLLEIEKTSAKPHEAKELTYYADNYLRQLGNKIGAKITIVDGGRYNPRAKGYGSYHNVDGISQAADVSMSEHSVDMRKKIIKSELDNPLVKKIGTSDPVILKAFPPAKYSKIVDERGFDNKHGTNHINHAHMTLNVSNERLAQNTASQKIMVDANGNRALVAVDSNGKPVKVLKEL